MDRSRLPWAAVVGLLAAPCIVSATERISLGQIIVGQPLPEPQRAADVKAVEAFYNFWNSGDPALLKQALSETFTDRTLPPGRPQGPQGPAFASRQFRAAVPDLHVKVEKVLVASPYVTVHMKFSGHFTGTFGSTLGQGQAIGFIATDLLELANGRIINNWHIEDNLSLLKQMEIVP